LTLVSRSDATNLRLPRLPVLDGWRGISILLVMSGHMLPLGPKWLMLNAMVAASGLSIFFFLSGFLVVSMLLRNDNIASFFVRRLFRILPLAWMLLIVMLLVQGPPSGVWLANLLFYANIFPNDLLPHGEHLWSLSVEVQFYLTVGLAVAIFGRRGLILVPVACLVVTLARIYYGMGFSIVTWFRVDEILVGGTVALFMNSSRYGDAGKRWPAAIPFVLIPIFFLTCHQSLVFANYLRPYVTALLVYSTIYRKTDFLQEILSGKALRYLAQASYALYVIHPVTYAGWLGEGDVVVRYTKRILSFFLTFCFAHVSKNYYEKYWNEMGHELASRIEQNNSKEPSLRSKQIVER
jgi:peptidoglycan/LPS O-acetylase OafA/YrhL